MRCHTAREDAMSAIARPRITKRGDVPKLLSRYAPPKPKSTAGIAIIVPISPTSPSIWNALSGSCFFGACAGSIAAIIDWVQEIAENGGCQGVCERSSNGLVRDRESPSHRQMLHYPFAFPA